MVSEHLRCPNILGKYGDIQNAFTKEGAGVSGFYFCGVGGLFFPGAGLLKQ